LFIICSLNPRESTIHRLGWGFLEKVYENALVIELRKAGLRVAQQQLMEVRYDRVVVGTYVAGLVVEGAVLLEIKAVRLLDEIHTAQSLNYLKATGLSLCLLINFGRPRVDIKRVILTTDTSR
jgi:GxxExxY protein